MGGYRYCRNKDKAANITLSLSLSLQLEKKLYYSGTLHRAPLENKSLFNLRLNPETAVKLTTVMNNFYQRQGCYELGNILKEY